MENLDKSKRPAVRCVRMRPPQEQLERGGREEWAGEPVSPRDGARHQRVERSARNSASKSLPGVMQVEDGEKVVEKPCCEWVKEGEESEGCVGGRERDRGVDEADRDHAGEGKEGGKETWRAMMAGMTRPATSLHGQGHISLSPPTSHRPASRALCPFPLPLVAPYVA